MLGAYTLLAFLSSWNSFLWPQIVLQDESKYTLPIGLTNMMGLPGFDTEYGALMAGLRAGLVTDQWPLMNGAFFPGPSTHGESLGQALFADPAIVHFIHRWWAWVAVAALVWLARKVKRAGARRASIAIHSAFGTQILLGIAVVMAGVPIWLAALHQLTGALLAAATAWGVHELGQQRG